MGEEATIAAPTAQAPQQRRPLRESVLDGRFFGQQDSDAAGELAAFLHGKLGFGEALEAWFGEAVTSLLAAGGDRTSNGRWNSTRASRSAASTRKNSACPAASPMA